MPSRIAVYEVTDTNSGEILSRHRTRQAAVDTWRLSFSGRPVKVYRVEGNAGVRTLIVEGTWHEATHV